jgi:hypothetical protein
MKAVEKQLLRLESELEAERAEKRLLVRQNKELRKTANLFEALAEHLGGLRPAPLKPLPRQKVLKKRCLRREHLAMHLSDMHADEIVTPEQTNGIEDFDFKIACLRAERYVDEVIEMSQQHLSNYSFSTLWILSYGDQSSGEIHGHVERSYFKNQLDNCLNIGRLQGLMIRDLSPYFERINVVCVPGNHGRRTHRKDFQKPQDSWDYLISRIAELNCQNLSNVKFLIPNAYSININVNGNIFNVQHGDGIKSWNSIPYYGIERKTRRLEALHKDTDIGLFCMGHFHQASDIPATRKGRVLVNGPWQETNYYAYDELGLASEPAQWIHGCSPGKPITWQKRISLKTSGERLRESRY